MIAAIVTALFAVAAGLPFTRRIGEAYLLGIGIEAGILFTLSMLGIPWSRPIVIGIFILFVLVAFFATPHPLPAILRFHCIDALTLILIAGYARFATIAPPVEIDFICIWGLKAEKFWIVHGIDWNFLAQPFNAFAHVDYPLLVPLAYDFQAGVGGPWIDRWAGALNIGCGIAALLIIRSEWQGWKGALAALVLMPLVFSPYIGIAEGPLIAYSIAGILPLRHFRNVTRAAVFLGLAASCKNEGLTLIAAVAIATVIAGAARLLPRLWPAVVIPMPWLIVSRLHHLKSDLTESGMLQRAFARMQNPLPLLQSMGEHPPGRVILWIGIIAALVIGARRVIREERFLAAVIALQLLAFVAAYLVTPHDVSWHVRWSWERLVLQLTALVTFLAIVVTIPKLPVVEQV